MNNLSLHSQGCKCTKEDWQFSRIWQLETEMSRLLLYFSILFCLLALTFSYILSPIHHLLCFSLDIDFSPFVCLNISPHIKFTGPVERRISQSTLFTSYQIWLIFSLYHLSQTLDFFPISAESLVAWKQISQSYYYIPCPPNFSIFPMILSQSLQTLSSKCRCAYSFCLFCLSLCVARSVSQFKFIRGSVKSSGKWTLC